MGPQPMHNKVLDIITQRDIITIQVVSVQVMQCVRFLYDNSLRGISQYGLI